MKLRAGFLKVLKKTLYKPLDRLTKIQERSKIYDRDITTDATDIHTILRDY